MHWSGFVRSGLKCEIDVDRIQLVCEHCSAWLCTRQWSNYRDRTSVQWDTIFCSSLPVGTFSACIHPYQLLIHKHKGLQLFMFHVPAGRLPILLIGGLVLTGHESNLFSWFLSCPFHCVWNSQNVLSLNNKQFSSQGYWVSMVMLSIEQDTTVIQHMKGLGIFPLVGWFDHTS